MGKEVITITNRSVGMADDKENRLNRIMDRLKARLCKINDTAREKQATVSGTGIFRLIAPARFRSKIASLHNMRAALIHGDPSAFKPSEIISRFVITQKMHSFF